MSQETSAPQSLGCDEARAGEGQAGAIACHFIAPSDRERDSIPANAAWVLSNQEEFCRGKVGKDYKSGKLGTWPNVQLHRVP